MGRGGGGELSGEGNELMSAYLASGLGHHAILEKAGRGGERCRDCVQYGFFLYKVCRCVCPLLFY